MHASVRIQAITRFLDHHHNLRVTQEPAVIKEQLVRIVKARVQPDIRVVQEPVVSIKLYQRTSIRFHVDQIVFILREVFRLAKRYRQDIIVMVAIQQQEPMHFLVHKVIIAKEVFKLLVEMDFTMQI